MSLSAALYSPSTLYSLDEKGWQFKSPKNATVGTGYFWGAKNRRMSYWISHSAFSKIL